MLVSVVAGQVFWWPHDLPDGADMGKQRVVLLGEAVSRHCIEVSCPRSLAQPADSLLFLITCSTTIVETTFLFNSMSRPTHIHKHQPIVFGICRHRLVEVCPPMSSLKSSFRAYRLPLHQFQRCPPIDAAPFESLHSHLEKYVEANLAD